MDKGKRLEVAYHAADLSDSESDSKPDETNDDSEAFYDSTNTSIGSETVTQSSSLLAEDPFGNAASKLLFDAIDKLRDCGAGRDIDLPQVQHDPDV